MNLNETQVLDFNLTALCVYREARGEPLEGKKAVAWVIRNRTTHPGWWGTDWASVVLHPKAFASFNHDDKNATSWPSKWEAAWTESIAAAKEVWEGVVSDPTDGSTNYYADSMKPPPLWAAAMTHTITIGHHLFFK